MRYERRMSLVRLVARPLLAAKFIWDGVDHARHPSTRSDTVAPAVTRLAGLTKVPDDPDLIVRVNGIAMSAAGVLLALGKAPRLSATVLALTVLPATIADNNFWSEPDPEAKRAKRRQFLNNLGLFGGVLLATVDTAGQPGLAWRGNRAVKDAKRAGRLARRDAERVVHDVTREAHLAKAKMEAALA